jgi:DNA-binding CsgD family transcriptional regulator
MIDVREQLCVAVNSVEVGVVACDHAKALGLERATVCLFGRERRIALRVDSDPDCPTEDPGTLVDNVLETHAQVQHGRDIVDPILEPAGVMGFVACRGTSELDPALARSLGALATYVSLRLVQLGVSAWAAPVPPLTTRERQIAELACQGLTNPEIAQVTRTSVNTIKKHLKAAFVRADVNSRTELAVRLLQSAPLESITAGRTRIGNVWVTKPAQGTRSGHGRLRDRAR